MRSGVVVEQEGRGDAPEAADSPHEVEYRGPAPPWPVEAQGGDERVGQHDAQGEANVADAGEETEVPVWPPACQEELVSVESQCLEA